MSNSIQSTKIGQWGGNISSFGLVQTSALDDPFLMGDIKMLLASNEGMFHV